MLAHTNIVTQSKRTCVPIMFLLALTLHLLVLTAAAETEKKDQPNPEDQLSFSVLLRDYDRNRRPNFGTSKLNFAFHRCK